MDLAMCLQLVSALLRVIEQGKEIWVTDPAAQIEIDLDDCYMESIESVLVRIKSAREGGE
jgi:hypothetical protein